MNFGLVSKFLASSDSISQPSAKAAWSSSRDSAWALVAGFLGAETHQKQVAARLKHVGQGLNIAAAVVVGEAVEQAAIQDRGVPFIALGEGERIGNAEVGRQAALGGFGAGAADRLFQEIEAGDLMAARGKVQRGVAGAAADIKEGANDSLGNGDERRLWPADVPGRFAGVGVLESL